MDANSSDVIIWVSRCPEIPQKDLKRHYLHSFQTGFSFSWEATVKMTFQATSSVQRRSSQYDVDGFLYSSFQNTCLLWPTCLEDREDRWFERGRYVSPTYNAVLTSLPRLLNNYSHLGSPSVRNPHEGRLDQRCTSGPNDSVRTLPHRV